MPRFSIAFRWMVAATCLILVGCDPGHKETVRTKKDDDPMAWPSSVVGKEEKDDSPAATEKGGIFGGKRLQGGLDDTSRDIEKSLGVN